MYITIKPPRDCDTRELGEFAKLVMEAGEVTSAGLDERVRRAHALVFAREGQDLCGVAALKSPGDEYRKSIFTKTGVATPAIEYPFELGWLFVTPSARGKRLAHSLVSSAITYAESTRVFATTRTNNAAMLAVLLKSGFVRHGQDYESNRGAYHLTLFLHES